MVFSARRVGSSSATGARGSLERRRRPVFLRFPAATVVITVCIASSPALSASPHAALPTGLPAMPQITTGALNSNIPANIVHPVVPVNVPALAGVKPPTPGNSAGNGLMTTSKGETLLAPGRSIELADPGTPDLRVVVTAPENQSLDVGKIVAGSGRMGIYAGLGMRASVQLADSAVVTAGGRVRLVSTTRNAGTNASDVAAAKQAGEQRSNGSNSAKNVSQKSGTCT